MAEALMAEAALNNHAPDTTEAPVDMFSFDLPEDTASQTTTDDPFNFDEDPATSSQASGEFSFDEGTQSAQAKAEEEAFADLLESTSQDTKDSGTISSAESDLNNFSWDDTPEVATTSVKPADDDFNSLFGELDDPVKK
jgi:hypothetical protein